MGFNSAFKGLNDLR